MNSVDPGAPPPGEPQFALPGNREGMHGECRFMIIQRTALEMPDTSTLKDHFLKACTNVSSRLSSAPGSFCFSFETAW